MSSTQLIAATRYLRFNMSATSHKPREQYIVKKRLIIMLATASLVATPVVFGETSVVELGGKASATAESEAQGSAVVYVVHFDKPIADLTGKMAKFTESQRAGERYTVVKAADFFGGQKQYQRAFSANLMFRGTEPAGKADWHEQGVPVTSVTYDGKTKTTTLKSVMVKTGYATSVSFPEANPGKPFTIEMKIQQILPVAGTETSPYNGATTASVHNGDIMPLLWTNRGEQYGAFLEFHSPVN
jgi:flagellar hook-associated protein FlgK